MWIATKTYPIGPWVMPHSQNFMKIHSVTSQRFCSQKMTNTQKERDRQMYRCSWVHSLNIGLTDSLHSAQVNPYISICILPS